MREKKISLSAITVALVMGLVTFMLIWTVVFFLSAYLSGMEQSAVTNSEQAIVQVSNTVSNYTDEMKDIMEIVEKSYHYNSDARKNVLDTLTKARADLVGIFVYDENGGIIESYTGSHQHKVDSLKDLTYMQGEWYGKSELFISPPHVESLLRNYYPWVVSILQEIAGENGKKNRVAIDIRFSRIADYIDDVGIGKHGYCFIADLDGELVYHPQQQLIYAGLKDEIAGELAQMPDGCTRVKSVLYTVETLENCGWRIVGVSYINELVTEKLISVLKILAMMLLFILMAALVSSIVLSKKISKPIENLAGAMREFEQNAEEYSFKSVGGTAEIQALSLSFEHMVTRIQQLMIRVRQEEVTLRKTELKALQAQINPHFLYNTLDAIGWLCEEERSRDAVEMVNALAKLFRISISKGHELITIEKELEHAQSYLKIENFRYKNQFTYDFEVEEECLAYFCNKITLQPIIENAIYHGLNRMIDEGRIVIRVFAEAEDVIFEVEDNGVGMTPEQCQSILHKEQGDKSGIGIKNVNDRIKIYFGEKYGLSIVSELDEGTKVIIRMPKVRDEITEKQEG